MRDDLKELPLYVPPSKSMLNLVNNENYHFDWHALLGDNMIRILEKTKLNAYGTSNHDELVKAYATYAGVDTSQIVVAPGSDSLIPLCMNALAQENVLTFETDFFRYHQAALIAQKENIRIPFDGDYISEVIQSANQKEVELIMFSNPNNPLGIIHSREDIIRILDNTSCYVVVDEAYFEFADCTVVDLVDRYDKLIVLRTLSKAWGLAGLRVGFAISNAKTVHLLKCVQGPFVLSDINGIIASIAMTQSELMVSYVNSIIENRKEFNEFIGQYENFKLFDSHTNFVYVSCDNAADIVSHLKQDDIAVAQIGPNGIRITVGTKVQMRQLMDSLKKLK